MKKIGFKIFVIYISGSPESERERVVVGPERTDAFWHQNRKVSFAQNNRPGGATNPDDPSFAPQTGRDNYYK
jgi:hypothetical protein